MDASMTYSFATNGITKVLNSDGSLWTCGAGTTNMTKSTSITNVSKILDGVDSDFYILSDGTVYGYPTISNVKKIIQKANVSNKIRTYFLLNDGTLKGVGDNSLGYLGIGNTITQSSPVTIATGVSDIYATTNELFVIKSDGTTWGCGGNGYGQLGTGDTIQRNSLIQLPLTNVSKIYSFLQYSVYFLMVDGTVKVAGKNQYGELGTGNTTQVTTYTDIGLNNITDIHIGYFAAFFLMTNNTVKACGLANQGVLGLSPIGGTSIVNVPTAIQGLVGVIGIYTAAVNTTLFLMSDSTVYATGYNFYGLMGTNSSYMTYTPQKVNVTNVKQIYTSTTHALFLLNDNTVKGVGQNNYGQLGLSNTTATTGVVTIPVTNVKNIVIETNNIFYALYDDTIWGSGANGTGELNQGNTIMQNTIVLVWGFIYLYVTCQNGSNLGLLLGDKVIDYTIINTKNTITDLELRIDNTISVTKLTNTPINVAKQIVLPYDKFYTLEGINHTANLIATDNNGKTYTLNVAFSKQSIVPVISDGDKDLGTLYTSPVIKYTINDPDNSSLIINEFFDGVNLNSFSGVPGTEYTFIDVSSQYTSASVGQHTLKITARDNATTVTRTFTFTKPANVAPIISGSDTNLGTLYNSQAITYSVTDSDNSTTNVTEWFDDSALGVFTRNNGTTYTVKDWQTYFNSASVGSHTIKISASDGVSTVNRLYTFTKAASPITFTNAGDTQVGTFDNGFTVNFTVNNALNNVTHVDVKLDGTLLTSLNPITLNVNIPVTISTTTVQGLKKGDHNVDIIATDTAGNTATHSYVFTKVNNKPQISTTKYDYGTTISPITISYSVSELDGDTLTYTAKVDGVSKATGTISSGANTLSTSSWFSSLANGNHVLTLVVNDGTDDSNTLSFTFNKVDSYVILSTSNTDLGSVSQPFTFTFKCTNVLNNVTNVVVKIDGATTYKTLNNVSLTDAISVSIDQTTYTGLSVASHVINLIATDSANNTNSLNINFKKEPNVPSISGVDSDLGKINVAPNVKYIVTDPNSLANTVSIMIDNTIIVYNKPVTLGTEYVQYFTTQFGGLTDGVHTIKIITTNGTLSATRQYTFNKISQVIVASTTVTNLGNLSDGFTINYTTTNQLAYTTYYTVSIDDKLYQGSKVTPQNFQQLVTIDTTTFDSLDKGSHIVKVDFVDTASNTSELTYSFVKNASGARISGIDSNFGDVSIVPKISYIITNPDGDPTNVVINLDSTTIQSLNNVELGKINNLVFDTQFNNLDQGTHTITITATSNSISTVRTYTFNKLSTSITVTMDMNQIHPQMNNFNNIKMNILDNVGPTVTLNVFIDSAKVDTILNINNGDYTYSLPTNIWESLSDGLMQFKLEFVSHTNGSKTNINFALNKVGGLIDFMLKTPIVLKNIAYRILVDADYYLANGAVLQVLVTNNPFALNPVWEDMTAEFLNRNYHVFTNTANDAPMNGISIRFKVDVGSSDEESWIGRFGIYAD